MEGLVHQKMTRVEMTTSSYWKVLEKTSTNTSYQKRTITTSLTFLISQVKLEVLLQDFSQGNKKRGCHQAVRMCHTRRLVGSLIKAIIMKHQRPPMLRRSSILECHNIGDFLEEKALVIKQNIFI
jgi:hypothetical protein